MRPCPWSSPRFLGSEAGSDSLKRRGAYQHCWLRTGLCRRQFRVACAASFHCIAKIQIGEKRTAEALTITVIYLPESQVANGLNDMVTHEWSLTVLFLIIVIQFILGLSEVLSVRWSSKVVHHDSRALRTRVLSHAVHLSAAAIRSDSHGAGTAFNNLLLLHRYFSFLISMSRNRV